MRESPLLSALAEGRAWSRATHERRGVTARSAGIRSPANRLLQVDVLSSIASRPLSLATSGFADVYHNVVIHLVLLLVQFWVYRVLLQGGSPKI